MVRKAAVAGMFYPVDRDKLKNQIKSFISDSLEKKRVKGLISPHAGYIYSGSCAGKGFSRVLIPDRVVILGVDHHGYGRKITVDSNEEWETPLGKIEVDIDFIEELIKNSEIFRKSSAGDAEHSIEVQVPFIQFLNYSAKIIPILVSTYDRREMSSAGEIIASVIKKQKNDSDTLIIASTDMSHYISAEEAKTEDSEVMKKIEKLDPDGMLDVVMSRRVSMCGAAPVYTMLKAVMSMGATNCKIVEYTNSGKVSGDYRQVVGYMSAVIS